MSLLAPKQEIQRRKEICRECPNAVAMGRLKFLRCALCACPIASKTMFQEGKCPAGKW